MKLIILVDTLQKKLAFLNHAVSNKSQLPVLQNILIEARDKTVTLSSTDLEIGIETTCQAEVLEEGGITVPTKQFTELIHSLPPETVTLETKDLSLLVTSKKTKSTFQTISQEEFPKLYDEKGILIAKMHAGNITHDISSVVFAASIDTTKPALSGIYVKQEKEGFLLVATDGYRLSLKRHPVTIAMAEQVQEDTAMIIPAKLFKELTSIKEASSEIGLFIASGSNQVVFEIADTLLIGRLIEAVYPNYEKIIPLDFSAKVSFNREELLKAVRICSIFARDSANIIKLSIQKNSITVSSQAAAVGENTVTIDASLSGEENEIAFNAKYLLDVLSNVKAEQLVFEMTGPLNPGVFKIENDESFLHLIMPIRVQQ
jgi:DNA polymerase III subunit beta